MRVREIPQFHNSLIRSDEGLTFETSAFNFFNLRVLCGLHLVYMENGGATLLVRTWQREKK